jgi:hypothetical protein
MALFASLNYFLKWVFLQWASGDAGPKHTGIEKSFRHPYRKFYYKYRTFPAFFTSVELVRYDYISHVELFR